MSQTVLVELARARLHGFSQREVDVACSDIMSEFETQYIERDQVTSEVGRT